MIEVSHLTKRYGPHCAVEDLTFTVEDGTIYGFLGPNGAGKSTTMNIMSGCLAASEGHVTIDGYDIFEQPAEAKRRIGYLPEQPPLYMDMTVTEYLAFVARAKGVGASQLGEQLEKACAVTGLQEVGERLIRNLSKGYRQRVGIAQALLGEPAVVILDEPTVGLDPLQIIEIRDLIRSLGKSHTVILSSHILSEVQAVCDQILLINKGRLVACDTPGNLERMFAGSESYELTAKAGQAELREALEAVPGVQKVELTPLEDGRCEAAVTVAAGAEAMDEKLSFALSDAKIPVLRLEQHRSSLEDVFISLTATEEAAETAQQQAAPGDGEKEEET